MKKNIPLRLATLLMIVTLLSTCLISGTFAKYIAASSGSASAKVASWSIAVNDSEIVTENPSIDFELFSTVNEAGGTTADTDIKSGKIAPGSGGSFAFDVDNYSDVTAKYSIALTVTNNSNIPIQYSTDKTNWSDSITAINTALADKNIAVGAATATHTVYWRWAFEGSEAGAYSGQTDATDTSLGTTAQGTAPQISVTATITATQVD